MTAAALHTITSTLSVRIVTYNVLSSHLADPTRFTSNDPTHLNSKFRLPKIFAKLSAELTNTNVIFCLQEISHEWAGPLHAFFANHHYAFVTGLYGKKFNGYMGVGLAYSMKRFETLEVNLGRVSDDRVGGWPKEQQQDSYFEFMGKIRKKGKWILGTARRYLNLGNQTIDVWDHARNRYNMMVCVRLTSKEEETQESLSQSQPFWVGTYHMPCAFYNPPVMNIHVDMAAARIQNLAKNTHDNDKDATHNNDDPFIFAGDFNILPNSPHYRLLTKGTLEPSDPTYPPSKHGVKWLPTLKSMSSAYAMYNGGKEPDFTNYARIKQEEPFMETLDYIFLSKGHDWKVKGVKELKDKEEVKVEDGGYFPNEVEGSDHYLLGVDLEL